MNDKVKKNGKITRLILVVTLLFFLLAGAGLYAGSHYIGNQLLQANENMAVDFALLVKNNFQITDEEVAYMKSLTFNEMEVDPINKRLMDVGNDVKLNTEIINVYLVAPLKKDEIKYTTDEETAEFFGYQVGTPLDGVWLLNGIIDEDGHFVAKQREDIYRYTSLTKAQKQIMESQTPTGEYSSDAWGNFITGYAPVYTTEGNFVGLLGIDMSPDKYQASAQSMIAILIGGFVIVSLTMFLLFIFFYFKYIKAKEGQLYFEFYSRMSHDMRTPMNGIMGMVALSREENDVEALHHNLSLIEESGQYMLGLINDTLDVQKLDAGRLKLDPKVRYCKEMVDSFTAIMKAEADRKKVHFQVDNENVDLDHYCYIDELRVHQIFLNIASNAIKFTPEGGYVSFIIRLLGREGSICHMKFQVKDTGIGMNEKFIHNHLFKPFEQEQNSLTTQYGGSGLGLSIVKNLVELMNGQIQVESEVGKGTTFTIYLDIKLEDETIHAPEMYANTKKKEVNLSVLENRTILLCEDHHLNAEIASRLLMKYNCKVVVAANGQDGIQMFAQEPAGTYDAILMDIRMPVMDGLTATKKIRGMNREDATTIPIIALTANAYKEDIQNCLDAGMNAHVAKPFEPAVLYETIARALDKQNE